MAAVDGWIILPGGGSCYWETEHIVERKGQVDHSSGRDIKLVGGGPWR